MFGRSPVGLLIAPGVNAGAGEVSPKVEGAEAALPPPPGRPRAPHPRAEHASGWTVRRGAGGSAASVPKKSL